MIVAAPVEAYLARLLPCSAPVLAEMEEQARQRNIPIVGPVVARLLRLVAEIHGARRVFELGSAIGYSTLWWAEAVGEGGEVFYTDNSAANAKEARSYFAQAGLAPRIHVLEGDALQSLAATPGEFDIIFIDLDKESYLAALEQALLRLRTGGLLIADNVLWRGLVAEAGADSSVDAPTRAIAAFNRKLYAERRLEPVIVPLRDGVAIARVVEAGA